MINLDDGATPYSNWNCSFFAVAGHVWSHEIREQRQHLAVIGVAAGLGLGVDQVPVDGHVEHAVVARHEAQVGNDVLVVGEGSETALTARAE